MQALILAGGLGTRLAAVLQDRPKPMAEVQGKPFLAYQIEQLREQGFTEPVLCVGHLASQILEYFGAGWRWGVRIRYAVETDLLGTAGAIRNACHFIDGTFLVLNGDSYLEMDFRDLVACHEHHRSIDRQMLGTIAAVRMEDGDAYGRLELDEQGRVLRFHEKASSEGGWVNGGVYVLEPDVLRCIPAGRAVSLERDTFPKVLNRGWHLFSYPVEGFFVDIGTPRGYQRFQHYVEVKGL